MADITLGSYAHRKLFCQSFIDTHIHYEPEHLPWPVLDDLSLQRLQCLPFWAQTLQKKQQAGQIITTLAQSVKDPLVQEALALQGLEQNRQARLLKYLIESYDISISALPLGQLNSNLQTAFVDVGLGACLDSFLAFGLFELAVQAHYLPEAFLDLFDPILDQEARQVVFFVNCVAYHKIKLNWRGTELRSIRALWQRGGGLLKLSNAFGRTEADGNLPSKPSEADIFIGQLTAKQFFDTCLEEHHRRMTQIDPGLLQPQLAANLAHFILSLIKLWPQRQPTSTVNT